MQRVDPFIPVATHSPRPFRPEQRVAPRAIPAVQRRVFDGVFVGPKRKVYAPSSRPRSAATSVRRSQIFQDQFRPQATKSAAQNHAPRAAARSGRLATASQASFIVLGSMAVGLLVQSLVLGEIAIALYAIFALLRRVESRTTFMLALFSLLSIVLLLIVRPNGQLANNFAVYTFLLLVVGTVTLGRELRSVSA